VATRSSAYCPVCRQQRLVERATANNLFHLVLTVLTGGLWLIVWLLQGTSRETATWRCTVCGTAVATGVLRMGAARNLSGSGTISTAPRTRSLGGSLKPCRTPDCTCGDFARAGEASQFCACGHPAGEHVLLATPKGRCLDCGCKRFVAGGWKQNVEGTWSRRCSCGHAADDHI
jgi:hypothetical protein